MHAYGPSLPLGMDQKLVSGSTGIMTFVLFGVASEVPERRSLCTREALNNASKPLPVILSSTYARSTKPAFVYMAVLKGVVTG
jgi:hypothetical protein